MSPYAKLFELIDDDEDVRNKCDFQRFITYFLNVFIVNNEYLNRYGT